MQELPHSIRQTWLSSIARLKDLGAHVVSISLPHTKHAVSAYYIIAPAEAASNLARYDGLRYGPKSDGETTQARYMHARDVGFGGEVQRRILYDEILTIGAVLISSGQARTCSRRRRIRGITHKR